MAKRKELGIFLLLASSLILCCSTTAPDISHLLDDEYNSVNRPISMKVDLGPFSGKDFHYSELGTAIGVTQKIYTARYCSAESFENINFNPQAGLSLSLFSIGHFLRGAMNCYIATSVIGDRRRTADDLGGYSVGIAWTHYVPLLYGIQSRFGSKSLFLGIDYTKNSFAYDGRVWRKEHFWDYIYGPLEFYRNPISENYVLSSWKISVTTKIPLLKMGFSFYFSPAVKSLLNRVGLELSDSPKIE
jgi:hypothetical protein